MSLQVLLRRGRRLRTIGIDDGPFVRGHRREVLVVGAVYSAMQFEGLLATRVRHDGHNATDRLIRMIVGSKFQAQLHLCLLDGITMGGFNVVDLPRLAAAVGLPCVSVMRRRPDLRAVQRALAHLSRARARWEVMCRAGPIHQARSVCFQAAGVDQDMARRAIDACVLQGHVPECLRAAHLIASGIVTGESGRRA